MSSLPTGCWSGLYVYNEFPPQTACAALGTGGLLASPKTQVVKELLDTLNTGGIEFWVGLDDM